MSDHDPLCGLPEYVRENAPGCRCLLITAVEIRTRADERERHGDNCGGMWDEWLHDLRAEVEALPVFYVQLRDESYALQRNRVLRRADVLALLDGGE